jgi:ABC-type amino acid transport substrate-binding protein
MFLIPLLLLVSAQPLYADTLKTIADAGVIKVAYRTNVPPFASTDDNGQPVGYAVDLCRRIAAAVKEELKLSSLETRFVAVNLENRFSTLVAGDADILCAATTITLSRMKQVDFSLMTFLTGGAVLSKADAPIESISDLTGKQVAVIKDTSAATALSQYLEANLIDASVTTVESIGAARQKLDDGDVAALAHDQIVLIGQVMGAADPKSYAMSPELFSYEPYGLVLRRNDADFRLVVNRALAGLYRSGQYKQLYERWFGRAGVRPSPILAAMYQLQALPE